MYLIRLRIVLKENAGGETIKDMQNSTGCKINVSPPSGADINREIGLIGTRMAIEAAKRAIWDKVNTVVRLIAALTNDFFLTVSSARNRVAYVPIQYNNNMVIRTHNTSNRRTPNRNQDRCRPCRQCLLLWHRIRLTRTPPTVGTATISPCGTPRLAIKAVQDKARHLVRDRT